MPTLVPITQEITISRGVLAIDPLVNGVYEGAWRFGDSPGFTINIKGENFVLKSSESGLSETIIDANIGVERTASIECNNLSSNVRKAFLSAQTVTITQAAGTVTNEAMGVVLPGRMYQLGVTTLVPDGVNKISAVTLAVSAANFAVSTVYTVGQTLLNPTPDAFIYLVTVATTASAAALPTFPTAGATAVSGGVTIKNIGSTVFANVSDFTFDPILGHVNILETGAIAALLAQASVSLKAGYVKAASTTSQLQTGASSSVTGRLIFMEENALNPTATRKWVFESVTLTPDGDLALITDNKNAQAKFKIGINKLNSATPAIKCNGVPV